MLREALVVIRAHLTPGTVLAAIVLIPLLLVLGVETTTAFLLGGLFIVGSVGIELVETGLNLVVPGLGDSAFLAGAVIAIWGIVHAGDGVFTTGYGWGGWALLAIGCWICLDSVDRCRHAGAVTSAGSRDPEQRTLDEFECQHGATTSTGSEERSEGSGADGSTKNRSRLWKWGWRLVRPFRLFKP